MAFAGVLVKTLRGPSGQITIPGLGAVVAELQSWNLVRREENGSGNPTWDLHAVFRYQNDILLKNDVLEKQVHLVLNKDRSIDLCGWEEFSIDNARLIAKGVIQCPQT
jgi:hypothetical protein